MQRRQILSQEQLGRTLLAVFKCLGEADLPQSGLCQEIAWILVRSPLQTLHHLRHRETTV
jgi:hypothetical protein